MKEAKVIYAELAGARESAPVTSLGRRRGKLYDGRNEGFRHALMGAYGPREAGGGPTVHGAPCALGTGAYLAFFDWS